MTDGLVIVETACEHVTMSMGPVSADSWLRIRCPFGCDTVSITTDAEEERS